MSAMHLPLGRHTLLLRGLSAVVSSCARDSCLLSVQIVIQVRPFAGYVLRHLTMRVLFCALLTIKFRGVSQVGFVGGSDQSS